MFYQAADHYIEDQSGGWNDSINLRICITADLNILNNFDKLDALDGFNLRNDLNMLDGLRYLSLAFADAEA